MKNPLISIIIPAYNAGKYISETLDSVLNQTYSKWECIVVDDGSIDKTSEISKKYCEKDTRFRYIYQINKGASAARNTGIKNANGDYIQYLDADDIILPPKIEKMLEAYRFEDDNIIIYSDLVFVSEEDINRQIPSNFILDLGRNVNYKDLYKYYPLKLSIPPTCVLFKKEHVKHAYWNENLGPSEDWDYLLQLTHIGYSLKYYPEKFVLYRNSANSHSKQIEHLQKSNFYILNYWVRNTKKHLLTYIIRNAHLVNKSFFRYITSKTKKLILPSFDFKLRNIRLVFCYISIYPIALLFMFYSLYKILIKRIPRAFAPG